MYVEENLPPSQTQKAPNQEDSQAQSGENAVEGHLLILIAGQKAMGVPHDHFPADGGLVEAAAVGEDQEVHTSAVETL